MIRIYIHSALECYSFSMDRKSSTVSHNSVFKEYSIYKKEYFSIAAITEILKNVSLNNSTPGLFIKRDCQINMNYP
jgi:hypothetical protein